MADADYVWRGLLLDFNGTDEDTTLSDLSIWGHALTFVGGAKLEATGAISGATSLYLDGVDSCVTIPNHWALIPGVGNHSFEFDFKADDVAANMTFIGQWDTTSGRIGWRLRYDLTTNSLIWEVAWAGTSVNNNVSFDFDTDAAGAIDLFDGSTHHIALICDNNSERIAVDGILGADAQATTYGPDWNPDNPFTIGADQITGTNSNFVKGWIDNMRFTGKRLYTSPGPFTPPSGGHDTADPGDSTAYSYPATLPFLNMDAETRSHYPWVDRAEVMFNPYAPVPEALAGPAGGSYAFHPGRYYNTNNIPTTEVYQDLDLTRMDSRFIDDIDAGIALVDLSIWLWITIDVGRHWARSIVTFYNAADEDIGRFNSPPYNVTATSTWEEFTLDDIQVPIGTRRIRVHWGTNVGAVASTNNIMRADDLSVTMKLRADANVHDVTQLYTGADMVSSFTPSTGTPSTLLVGSTTTNRAWGVMYRVTTGFGTPQEAESPVLDLLADATDIDAGNATYSLRMLMANEAVASNIWLEFYEADGTTIVGSRISSTSAVKDRKGDIITLSGTTPANARKVIVGVAFAGATVNEYRGTDMTLTEIAPTLSSVVDGSGPGITTSAIAISLGLGLGAD